METHPEDHSTGALLLNRSLHGSFNPSARRVLAERHTPRAFQSLLEQIAKPNIPMAQKRHYIQMLVSMVTHPDLKRDTTIKLSQLGLDCLRRLPRPSYELFVNTLWHQRLYATYMQQPSYENADGYLVAILKSKGVHLHNLGNIEAIAKSFCHSANTKEALFIFSHAMSCLGQNNIECHMQSIARLIHAFANSENPVLANMVQNIIDLAHAAGRLPEHLLNLFRIPEDRRLDPSHHNASLFFYRDSQLITLKPIVEALQAVERPWHLSEMPSIHSPDVWG